MKRPSTHRGRLALRCAVALGLALGTGAVASPVSHAHANTMVCTPTTDPNTGVSAQLCGTIQPVSVGTGATEQVTFVCSAVITLPPGTLEQQTGVGCQLTDALEHFGYALAGNTFAPGNASVAVSNPVTVATQQYHLCIAWYYITLPPGGNFVRHDCVDLYPSLL